MKGLLHLELRKQGLAFIGLASVIVLSLPLAWLAAALSHAELRYALQAVLSGWAQLGLPAFAALLGASAGAGLRAEPSAQAEAVLPLSPARRAGAALAAAAIQLAALAAIILLIALVAVPDSDNIFVDPAWTTPVFQQAAFQGSLFGLSCMLLASFFWAYAFGSGLAGGLFGSSLAGIAWAALATVGVLQFIHEERDLFSPAALLMVKAACLGSGGYALGRMSSRLERGEDWRGWCWCGLIFLAGPFLCVLSLGVSLERLVHRLVPVYQQSSIRYGDLMAYRLLPGLRKIAMRGLLVENRAAELVLLRPDGRREILLPGVGAPVADAFTNSDGRRSVTVWDEDGSLWALRLMPQSGHLSAQTLFHCRPGESLSVQPRQDGVPAGAELVRRGRQIGRYAWVSRSRYRFTSISAKGPPVARPVEGEALRILNEGWAEQGLAATVSKDGMSLKWRNQTWRLPDRAKEAVIPAVTPGPAPVFAVTVTGEHHRRYTVLCRPGRKAESLWGGAWFQPQRISSDGTLWGNPLQGGVQAMNSPKIFLMLRPDGTAAPILDVRPALNELEGMFDHRGHPHFETTILLRVTDSDAWAVLTPRTQPRLARVDVRTGKLKESWELPGDSRGGFYDAFPVEEGFFFHDGERIWFVDWEGRAKKLV